MWINAKNTELNEKLKTITKEVGYYILEEVDGFIYYDVRITS